MTIGGWYNTNPGKMTGAKINYIAVFADTYSYKADEDVTALAAFSPTAMTSSASPADGDTLSSDDNSTLVSTGINLPANGSVTISGEVTIAALFVQENTTLVFAKDSTLTVSGPIYVAEEKTLTVSLSATPTDYENGVTQNLLVGTIYGDIVQGSLPSVSGGRTTFDVAASGVSWSFKPMPIWNNGSWTNPDAGATEITINSTTSAEYGAGGNYTTVYVEGSETLPKCTYKRLRLFEPVWACEGAWASVLASFEDSSPTPLPPWPDQSCSA